MRLQRWRADIKDGWVENEAAIISPIAFHLGTATYARWGLADEIVHILEGINIVMNLVLL